MHFSMGGQENPSMRVTVTVAPVVKGMLSRGDPHEYISDTLGVSLASVRQLALGTIFDWVEPAEVLPPSPNRPRASQKFDPISFGNNLRRVMRARELTNGMFAELMGCSKRQIEAVIYGRYPNGPNAVLYEKILRWLDEQENAVVDECRFPQRGRFHSSRISPMAPTVSRQGR